MTTTTIPARELRVGYSVKAEGAPAWSAIRKVYRSTPVAVTVKLDWGRLDYELDEPVTIEAALLPSVAMRTQSPIRWPTATCP